MNQAESENGSELRGESEEVRRYMKKHWETMELVPEKRIDGPLENERMQKGTSRENVKKKEA